MKKDLKITYLKKPKKFLDKQSVISETDVDELVIKFIKRHFYGANTNIDYRALQGNLRDFFRIRKGGIRIIIRVTNGEILIEAIVEDIGFRGDIY